MVMERNAALEVVPHDGIQAVEGFVAEQHPGVQGKAQADLRPLLGSLGKAGDALVHGQREPLAQLLQLGHVKAGVVGRLHPPHFRNAGVGQEGGFVAQVANVLLGHGVFVHRHGIQQHIALLRLQDAGHHPQKGGFSGAVGAQHAENMPFLQPQGKIGNGPLLSKILLNLIDN